MEADYEIMYDNAVEWYIGRYRPMSVAALDVFRARNEGGSVCTRI